MAIQLELSRGERKVIEKDEEDCSARFVAVLEQWKESANQPYTWKIIVSVLKLAFLWMSQSWLKNWGKIAEAHLLLSNAPQFSRLGIQGPAFHL